MRINKFLSECGVCSRREADVLIEKNDVMINGEPAQFGAQVEENDIVEVCGKRIKKIYSKTYLAYNKPVGIVCTSEKKEKNNLIDFLNYPKRITYAGRLDKESSGLLILTDDGDMIDALMTGRNGHEKEYIVTVNKPVDDNMILQLSRGMFLKEVNKRTNPCRAWKTGEREFHIVLTQGINRQIRRMCQNIGLKVIGLKRIRIGKIFLGKLKPGEYRSLTDEERIWLKKLSEQTGRSNKKDDRK